MVPTAPYLLNNIMAAARASCEKAPLAVRLFATVERIRGGVSGIRVEPRRREKALDATVPFHILKSIEYSSYLSNNRHVEGRIMSEDMLGRIRGDLAVMQRAMGLRLSFGKGMLVFDTLLALAATGAALVSLQVETDWLQQAPFAAIMVLVPVGLFVRSRRTSHEINLQVVMSITIYAIVWIAACGYMLASQVGPIAGTARTALLDATSVGILIAATLILVRAALRNRALYYCLGLALSTVLAGMLLPILGQHYSYSVAHGCMAVGYLTGFVIQWVQLREAAANHAAD